MAAKHFSDRGTTGDVSPQDTGTIREGATTRRMSDRTANITGRKGQRPRQATIGKHSHVVVLAVLAVVVAAVVLAVILLLPNLLRQPEADTTTTTVTVSIPDGSGATAIGTLLEDAKVVDSADEFVQAVNDQGVDSQLKSGTYTFTTHMSVDDVITQLIAGPNTTENQVTIPEGYTLSQIASTVQSSLGIDSDEFIAQAKASNYVSDFSFLSEAQNDSLEGFLWPKTYDFTGQEVTADTVIRAMLTQYATETGSYDFSSAEAQLKSTYGVDFNDYDILIMASIIEREAVTSDDRPLVSSVFYNRLAKGMRLQSDATMGYVTGGAVTADDLKTESPYNSYLNDGLPPTPICSPSAESLDAALHPSSTNYYYFLIIEDGDYSNHTFSETYEQHQAAIAEAQSAGEA